MNTYRTSWSLMLMFYVLLSLLSLSASRPHGYSYYHRVLAGRGSPTGITKDRIPANAKVTPLTAPATPCSGSHCTTATPLPESLPCDAANGTTFGHLPGGANYTLICDIDFPAQNIYPFILAGSFHNCLAQCESYNQKSHPFTHCAGFVFAPDRVHDADDCYLKSSLNDPIYPATLHLVGGTVMPPATSYPYSPSMPNSYLAPRSERDASPSVPTAGDFRVPGSSTDKRTKQYVSHVPATPQKLASNVLVPGIDTALTTKHLVAGDADIWREGNIPRDLDLASMKAVRQVSKDGGKGGTIDGIHLSVLCDTANFRSDRTSQVISSVSIFVATDVGMNALYGKPLDLIDNLDEWQDDVDQTRGFAPMTPGEEFLHMALSGNGYRSAVWSVSSLVPLNASHVLLYPALVYDVVDTNIPEGRPPRPWQLYLASLCRSSSWPSGRPSRRAALQPGSKSHAALGVESVHEGAVWIGGK
ncbi:uncharacterized protein Z518_04216 [Rhinocladiella mackenziei CBS 650.93]|uniref:Rhinocladiella mackenziei CBS 650.93 unplaced genomic scaffold supercont1.3, whole genome shotgun sequence n=1 Tax=Rhinocladiella mackenziei CBS 650.93 TaxID=1442369 RepID=A0A0D2IST1_9EURO|nr:uncharacterized protein Z518_04216 [Rhinocladiella mackenziei CBS 650.93]KIX06241.1 hypothetical protein Z518_04216 [Rhinocladiella mackenziei CBS 650.93]